MIRPDILNGGDFLPQSGGWGGPQIYNYCNKFYYYFPLKAGSTANEVENP